jgi:hypothetical protein
MLTRWFAVVVVALALLAPSAALAQTAAECGRVSETYGTCTVEVPTGPTAPVAQPVGNPETSGGGGPACVSNGREVPCSDPLFGTWSNANQCYIRRADPQPPPSSPLWDGRYPEGAIYDCVDPSSGPYSNPVRQADVRHLR